MLAFFALAGGALWLSGGMERLIAVGRGARDAASQPIRQDVTLRGPGAPSPAYAELRGRVVDRMGWPVVAAEVSIPGSDRTPTLTDENGRFRLELAGAVQRTLRIAAPGRHDPVQVRGSLDEIQVVLQDALPWTPTRFVATPGPRSLLAGEGFLKDPDGKAVPGARITVRPTGAMAETDENGRFVVPLPGSTCSLVAWDDAGHVAVSDELSFARRQGKVPVPDLTLATGIALRGRLVDAEGAPVPGMELVVDNAGTRRITQSTTDGAFVAAGLTVGETTVTVIPNRGLLGFRKVVDLQGDASMGDLVVDRVPQEPLRVRVIDHSNAAQAFVHVVAEQAEGLRRAYGTTDSAGEVVLSGLVPDAPTVFEVRDAGLEPMPISGYRPMRRALVVGR
jgi:hypothetical protein